LIVLLTVVVLIESIKVRPVSLAVEREFQDWNSKYGKANYGADYEKRLANYQASIVRVNEKNKRSAGRGATYAINKFSDLSPEEFRQMYLLKNFTKTPEEIKKKKYNPNFPTWRSRSIRLEN